MKRLLGAWFFSVLVLGTSQLALADDKEAAAILDKGIKALGGEEILSKDVVHTWKIKGSVSINGNDSEFTGSGTSKGMDQSRANIELEINGNKFAVTTVLNGDKGWRKVGDNLMPLDADGLATEKRNHIISLGVSTLVPFKGKGYKVESAGEEKVGDKPANVLKITSPDGKDFKISFDKESGLPVKSAARVAGFMGDEVDQEVLYKDYKDFGGRKRATKLEMKRDGAKFIDEVISDYKSMDKAEAGTFDEPQ
jgi:hypothetical protein